MKWKMADNSLFAILLRSRWWISFCVAAVIALMAAAALPRQYTGFGIVTGAPFLAIGIIAAFRQLRSPSPARVAATVDAARSLSWREFGVALEQAFQRDGYAVTRLDGRAADLAAAKADRVALVNAKRWKAASTGAEPLRALHDAMQAQGAPEGVFITTGALTEQARRFAAENQIRLIEAPELATLLHGIIPSKKTSA